MRKLFKYDLAISVAVEEKHVAKQIIEELKKKKIPYYYYEDDIVGSWGEYLINLTNDAYGKRARYVLMITSRTYKKKYWSNIELQIAVSNFVEGRPNILQLRLDDTIIDGLSKNLVYLDWNNNPEEVADILEKKIKRKKCETLRKELPLFICIVILIATILGSYYFLWPPGRRHWQLRPLPKAQEVIIPGISDTSDEGIIQRHIDSFQINNIEVTVAEYRKFCDSQHRSFPPQPPYSEENGPVRNVTWHEAMAYCKWVKGRLPTEAEWQYAASAGLGVKYSGGNNAKDVAVYGKGKPARIGTKVPNPFGLYDMTGNVAEWCDDWYDPSFKWKAVRGGSYNSKIAPVNELDLTYRTKEHPDIRNPYIGFRVAWNIH